MIQRIILGLLGLFAMFGGCLPLTELIVSMIISFFFCDISPDETYTWYSGIWHGVCFIPNWMFNGLKEDILYKAVYYTNAYNFWHWTFSISSTTFVLWLYNIPNILWALVKGLLEKLGIYSEDY